MFVRTERLLLRPGWPEDAAALARAIGDEAIVRNLATVPWPYGEKEAEAFLGSRRAQEGFSFLAFRRTHGAPQLIGSAGIHLGPHGEPELGYWIARPYWGLGYATEAAAAVIELAREGLRLKRVAAAHFVDNPASGRVLEKLGFSPTGDIVQRHSLARGRTSPSKTYCLRFDDKAKCDAWPIIEEQLAA